MVYGYDNLVEWFKNLVDSKKLSHAYLFFGQKQTGKFLFAKCLANYIEKKEFKEPSGPLLETLIVDFNFQKKEEGQESVGIDSIRQIEKFLYQRPVSASYRLAIIRDAEWLTDQAQNALLKILEEPPQSGVIVATATDYSVFLPTVASRMQKIYFKTLSNDYILDFLQKYGKIRSKEEAKEIAANSFGRIGRALDFSKNQQDRKKILEIIEKLASKKHSQKSQLDWAADELIKLSDKSPLFLELFFEEILIQIKPKLLIYPSECKQIVEEISWMQSLTVSKRIHLKNILCKTQFILSA